MNYNNIRRKTRKTRVGNVFIGGDAPIAIQSMTNTDTHDKYATLSQILSLERLGCDIVRITVPDSDAVATIPYLKANGVTIPIVADIHFDYKIAIKCADAGVDKIRINPGNIGSDDKVFEAELSADTRLELGTAVLHRARLRCRSNGSRFIIKDNRTHFPLIEIADTVDVAQGCHHIFIVAFADQLSEKVVRHAEDDGFALIFADAAQGGEFAEPGAVKSGCFRILYEPFRSDLPHLFCKYFRLIHNYPFFTSSEESY